MLRREPETLPSFPELIPLEGWTLLGRLFSAAFAADPLLSRAHVGLDHAGNCVVVGQNGVQVNGSNPLNRGDRVLLRHGDVLWLRPPVPQHPGAPAYRYEAVQRDLQSLRYDSQEERVAAAAKATEIAAEQAKRGKLLEALAAGRAAVVEHPEGDQHPLELAEGGGITVSHRDDSLWAQIRASREWLDGMDTRQATAERSASKKDAKARRKMDSELIEKKRKVQEAMKAETKQWKAAQRASDEVRVRREYEARLRKARKERGPDATVGRLDPSARKRCRSTPRKRAETPAKCARSTATPTPRAKKQIEITPENLLGINRARKSPCAAKTA